MPAASVATVASQARSLPQVSPSSEKAPSVSGEQPVQISQAFVRSCDRFPPALRAKFFAQEQDRLQQDAFQQTASLVGKRGALEKRSVVHTPSFSQELHTLARSNSVALPPAAPPLSTTPQPAAPLSIPSQNMLVPVRVLPPLPPVEYQSLALRE
eukprot:5830349-Pleurochrysis_carterae.AAC.1